MQAVSAIFFTFSLAEHALVEIPDRRVVADSGEHRHAERRLTGR